MFPAYLALCLVADFGMCARTDDLYVYGHIEQTTSMTVVGVPSFVTLKHRWLPARGVRCEGEENEPSLLSNCAEGLV